MSNAAERDDVVLVPPNLSLQRKFGGSAARLLNPGAVKKAEAALETIIDKVRGDVMERLHIIKDQSRDRPVGCRDTIWTHAHEIRGLAGTARLTLLGQSANLICRYLDETGPDFAPDANLMTTIVVTALQTIKDGAETDAMLALLVRDCARAVVAQREREGR
jgi:hypothetical protein